jgi:hypothetical protein
VEGCTSQSVRRTSTSIKSDFFSCSHLRTCVRDTDGELVAGRGKLAYHGVSTAGCTGTSAIDVIR